MPIRETYKPTYGPPTEAVKKDPIAGQKYREHLDLIKQLNKRDVDLVSRLNALESAFTFFAVFSGETSGGNLIRQFAFGCTAIISGLSIRLSYDTTRETEFDYVCGANIFDVADRFASYPAKSPTGLDVQFRNSAGTIIDPAVTAFKFYVWCAGFPI